MGLISLRSTPGFAGGPVCGGIDIFVMPGARAEGKGVARRKLGIRISQNFRPVSAKLGKPILRPAGSPLLGRRLIQDSKKGWPAPSMESKVRMVS